MRNPISIRRVLQGREWSVLKREKFVKRHLKYTCDFLRVYEDDVALPDGREAKRVVVDHVGAAAVLPITKEREVLLVRQHRYAAGIDSLEIPAGKKDDPGEDGIRCAKRELEEETGYTSEHLVKVMDVYSAIGFSNERIEIYHAYDATMLKKKPEADDDEYVELVRLPLEEAIHLAKSGEIKDAKTIIALLGVET